MNNDPISRIEWRDASSLNANEYNPNIVFTPELRLLERSILKTGWVQPVLITQDGTIIDGFHRHRLAQDSAKLREKYGGKVPCAVMDISPQEAMIVTIRMNRAKGTHVAVRMSEIVRTLIDQMGVLPEELAQDIGATKAEIDLLYQEGVFKMKNIKDYKYSKAWVPSDTRLEK
jgi:ParB-like chromosome segregation protein Spo0J